MRLILLLFILFTSEIYSQTQEITFVDTDFKKGIKYIENYSLVNRTNDDLVIVLAQGSKIKAYLYTKEAKEQTIISGTHLTKKYNNYVGYSISGSIYTLLFSSDNKKKYASVTFDFSSGTSDIGEVAMIFDDEELLNFVHFENKLLLLTAKDNNVLVIKEFKQDKGFVLVESFSFGDSNEEQLKEDLGFFERTKYVNTLGSLTLIDHHVPNSIERTSAENKLYVNGESLLFTFEDEEKETILHGINLSNLTHKRQTFQYPRASSDEFIKFNSLLFENTLYHLAISKEELAFQVKSLHNGEVLKEYRVSKDEEISFKNSSLYQNGSAMGMYSAAISGNNQKILKTTKQFLRKLSVSNVGVSIEKVNENLLMTLGGIDSSAGNPSIIGNPTYASYNGYVSVISMYFNSILNKEYNAIEKPDFKYENVFDKMKKFEDELSWGISHDIFYRNGKLYFTYWNMREQQYHLLSF